MRCSFGKSFGLYGPLLWLAAFPISGNSFATQPYDDEPIVAPKNAPYPIEDDLEPDSSSGIQPLVPLVSATTLTPPAAAPFEGAFFERKALTGDWGGVRTYLSDGGITADLSTTQYYQGTTTGGLQQAFQYGGRNDFFVNADGQKVGLWKGLFISLHGESRYGETINGLTGALMPANLMLAVPQPQGSVTALTALKLTQFLSESFLVYGGRLNMFDSFTQPITGSTALNGFMNTALMLNPVYARTIPYSTYGVGFAVLKDLQPVFSGAVIDTHNTPTVSGFNTLFDNGVTMVAVLNVPTQFWGQLGHQGISGTYSTGTYSNLEPTPWLDPITGPGLTDRSRSGSWCLTYNFDQALYTSSLNPKKVWGIFGNVGISDGNPNPIPTFWSLGLSGTSVIPNRLQDSCGFGYFYVDVSNSLKDLAPRLLPLQNEQGVELYYNYEVNPWFHVTPDVQLISPFRERAETSVVAGLRAKIDF